jgi:hypothetical protein
MGKRHDWRCRKTVRPKTRYTICKRPLLIIQASLYKAGRSNPGLRAMLTDVAGELRCKT